jgi:hypothetical protein
MLGKKGLQSYKWWQALLLVSLSAVIGLPSLDGLGRCAWGGSCQNPSLYQGGFVVAVMAFISGVAISFALALKWFKSKI